MSAGEHAQVEAVRHTVPAKIAARYATTPVFGPGNVRPGVRAHLGGGVWGRRCPDCGLLFVTAGAVLHDVDLLDHRLDAHGVQPRPLLPR